MNNDDFNDLYCFAVSVWMPGNDNPKSLFAKGHWMEYARCQSRFRADEVATCLSIRHPEGVQAAELTKEANGGKRWIGYKYLPETARNLIKKEKE